MKTIGIISDTHISTRSKQLPESVMTAFKEVDLILHAGDIVSLSVIETLQSIVPVKAVRGNMCLREVQDKLPEKLLFKAEDLMIGLTHGSGGPSGFTNRILRKFGDEKPDIIVHGHTHEQRAEIVDDTLFLNPGPGFYSVLILKINGSNYDYNFIDVD
jgi:putative phosphoesterase